MTDDISINRVLYEFLYEVLGYDAAAAEALQKGMGTSIDTNRIIKHVRCRALLAINHLSMQCFGLLAPKQLIQAILNKNILEWDLLTLDNLIGAIVSQFADITFAKYFVNASHPKFKDPNDVIRLVRTYLLTIAHDTAVAKQDLAVWLARASPIDVETSTGTVQLFKTYLEQCYPYYNYTTGDNRIHQPLINCLSKNTLDWVVIDDVPTPQSAPAEKVMQYDNRIWATLQDHDMFRKLGGATLLVATQENYVLHDMVKWLSEIGSLDKIVIAATDGVHSSIGGAFAYCPLYINSPDDISILPINCANRSFFIASDTELQRRPLRDLSLNMPYIIGACETIDAFTHSVDRAKAIGVFPLIITGNPAVSEACIRANMLFVPRPAKGNSSVSRDILRVILGSLNTEAERARAYTYNMLSHQYLKHFEKVSNSMSHTNSLAKQCLLLIDNRQNGLSLMSLYTTLGNLDLDKWGIVIITSNKQEAFYKGACPSAAVVTHRYMNREPFDIETYNEMLKDEKLWDAVDSLGYTHCLTIQDDGCIVRPGFDAPTSTFMKADYIGAPWIRATQNSELASIPGAPKMVGNGGLSWRNVKMCLDICKTSPNKNALFHHRLQRVQEDVFFAREIQARGGIVPSEEEAAMFSVEQVLQPNSLGFHKLWAYQTFSAVQSFLLEQSPSALPLCKPY